MDRRATRARARDRSSPSQRGAHADAVLGGVEQQLWFRGVDAANAVILLHGGPDASEPALFRHFNADLEHAFLMVYWEQRGTGRSYRGSIPPESMTIEQFVLEMPIVFMLEARRYNGDEVAGTGDHGQHHVLLGGHPLVGRLL